MNEPQRYGVEFRPAPLRALRKLPRQAGTRVKAAIEKLRMEPGPSGAVAIQGERGWYRIRVGDYRVVDEVRDTESVVLVLAVGHRREVYRRL